ncbi:DMT family transporter [Haladaptatus halobius]|uniref:DMT family transporter n=1 Tax=Haladaptatus halobius TaxID=2884875 RepID=UPI001D0A5330|nr:EamA family transporter [Haladaptatus halobius]
MIGTAIYDENDISPTMARVDSLAPLSASTLWGGMYIVSKWGFAAIPPVTLAFLRVVLGGTTLLLVVRLTAPKRSFSRSERQRFGVLGGWVALTLVTQFVGTDLTNASQGSLLTVLTPVFTLLLGVVVLDESLSGRKVGGMALAVVGTLVVLSGQYDFAAVGRGNLLGVLALFAASFGWAGYTVWGKPLVRTYSALETATYSTLASIPLVGVLVPIELASASSPVTAASVTPPVVGAVLYLGVLSTAAAWFLWYRGLEALDAGVVAVFFFAQPVVGAALGALFLSESLGPGFVAGGVVMGVGVWVVSTARA